MKKTIREYDLDGKKVIIRCDLNVPIENNEIIDDNRIKESLQTIKYALEHNAKVILLSHLGRIKTTDDMKNNSLKIVSDRLGELLGKKVKFTNETRGIVVENAIDKMKPQDIVLLENTRFEDIDGKKESTCDDALSRYWASLGDIFINDAFGTAHRAHASNVGIAKYIPSGIGFLVEKEIDMLSTITKDVKRPYVAVLGGAKMEDKIKVMDKLVKEADYVLLGGGIANTFLMAKGIDVGSSVYDEKSMQHAKELLNKYKNKIILPVDGYGSKEFKDNLDVYYTDINNVPKDLIILDLGDKILDLYNTYIKNAKTIFLNGPIGLYFFKNFEKGTKKLLEMFKESNANVVIGGGDSAACAVNFGYKDSFAHISTGGGASLEFIEGKTLPGIAAIDNK